MAAAAFAVIVIVAAIEFFVAGGTCDLRGINGLVEVNLLAAFGALYLVKYLVLVTVTVAITITVAIAVIIAVTAIAVAIIIAVAIVETLVNFLFKLSKIVVELVKICCVGINLILDGFDLVCHIGDKVEHLNYKLCLGLGFVEVKTLGKTLDICSLFKYSHCCYSFRYG